MQSNAEFFRANEIARLKDLNHMKDALKDIRDEMDLKTQEFVGVATAKATDDMDVSLLAAAKKRGLSDISNVAKAKAKKPKKVATKVTAEVGYITNTFQNVLAKELFVRCVLFYSLLRRSW